VVLASVVLKYSRFVSAHRFSGPLRQWNVCRAQHSVENRLRGVADEKFASVVAIRVHLAALKADHEIRCLALMYDMDAVTRIETRSDFAIVLPHASLQRQNQFLPNRSVVDVSLSQNLEAVEVALCRLA
jgi:hypothetical protein